VGTGRFFGIVITDLACLLQYSTLDMQMAKYYSYPR
jgi:hypothetical protein